MLQYFKIVGVIAALACASPVLAQDRDKEEKKEKVERTDKAPSPYSNRAQARKRAVRDAIRESADDDEGTYRFRRARRARERDDS